MDDREHGHEHATLDLELATELPAAAATAASPAATADAKPAKPARAKPATGSRYLASDGTVILRISLAKGVRISVPTYREPADPHLDWLQRSISDYARTLAQRPVRPLSRQEIATELVDVANRMRSVTDGRSLVSAWERVIASDVATRNADRRARYKRAPTFKDIAEDWLTGVISKAHPVIEVPKSAKIIRRNLERYVYPEVGHIPITEFRVRHFEQVYQSPAAAHLAVNSRILTWKHMTRVVALAEVPLELIERRPASDRVKPRETERFNACLQPIDDEILLGTQLISVHDRVFWGYLAREGVRISEAYDLRWEDLFVLGHSTPAVTHDLIKTDKRLTWVLSPGVWAGLRRYRERFRPNEPDTAYVFCPTFSSHDADEAQQFRSDLRAAGITRAELFNHNPSRNQYRVRAHDIRGLFVTRALAAGLPDSYIRDRTGHTSPALIEVYKQKSTLLIASGQTEFAPFDHAIPELRERAVPALPVSQVLPVRKPRKLDNRKKSNT